MKYYVEDAEQTPEVQKKLEEIRYKNVNPEDIRIIENIRPKMIQFNISRMCA
jgi:hypothetical protein